MKRKYILVGDLHAQVGNLEDTEVVFDKVAMLVREHGIEFVVYLGDMYHTHSVLRQEVVELLRRKLPETRGTCQGKPVVLVGNHDLVGPTSTSMNACELTLSDVAAVVSEPVEAGPVLYMPFTPDNSKFVEECKKYYGTSLVVCHQTFDGSQYENGFYAPGGVDQTLIPQKVVISGHIHKSQKVGKVTYVGTPRALTAAECDEDKGLVMMTYDDVTCGVELKMYSLNGLVKTYKKVDVQEPAEFDMPLLNGWGAKDHVMLHVHGSEDYCETFVKDKLPVLKQLRPKTTIKVACHVEKVVDGKPIMDVSSESVTDSLRKYVMEVADMKATLRERVWETISRELK
jgi:DNA repair exonuclease SbcCD nuclease subunit